MEHQVTEYNEIQAKIADLAVQYAEVPDCSTEAGLKLCKKQYREIRKFEINLDKVRKEKGQEARDFLNFVNDQAKVIDSSLKEVSGKFKDAFELREAEIAAEEERIRNEILEQIQQIKDFYFTAKDLDSDGVGGILQAVDLIDPTDEVFGDMVKEAATTKREVVTQLTDLLQQKLSEEAVAMKHAALQAKESIMNMKMIPANFITSTSDEIAAKVDEVLNAVHSEDWFGVYWEEFLHAKQDTLDKLDAMHTRQLEIEEMQRNAAQAIIDATDEETAPDPITSPVDDELPFHSVLDEEETCTFCDLSVERTTLGDWNLTVSGVGSSYVVGTLPRRAVPSQLINALEGLIAQIRENTEK